VGTAAQQFRQGSLVTVLPLALNIAAEISWLLVREFVPQRYSLFEDLESGHLASQTPSSSEQPVLTIDARSSDSPRLLDHDCVPMGHNLAAGVFTDFPGEVGTQWYRVHEMAAPSSPRQLSSEPQSAHQLRNTIDHMKNLTQESTATESKRQLPRAVM
jgi:hypothetical protein